MEKLVHILQIPERCLVHKKITKAFFKRNFELTSAEIKFLDDYSNLIQLDWIASIKPENSNIIASTQDQSVYEEIVIISVQTGDENFTKNSQKIAELIQKYIPYHILLCIYNNNDFVLNTCDKRVNQNDATKRTVEKQYFTENISILSPSEKQSSFLKSLVFHELDKQNLKSFYDAYTSRIIALQAAEIIHVFSIRNIKRSIQDVQFLENINLLRSEILSLQHQATKETQLNVQFQLNAAIQERRKKIKKLEDLIVS